MNDEIKAAAAEQAVQLAALTEAVRRFEQRLEALSNAVGTLDRVDEMSRKIDALAKQTRGFNGPASDTSLN